MNTIKNLKINRMILLLMLIVSLATQFTLALNLQADQMPLENQKAVVISSEPLAMSEDPYIKAAYRLEVELTKGALKGTVISLEHIISSSEAFEMHLEPGDRILVGAYEDEGGALVYYVEDYQRDTGLMWLLLIFIGTILWVGRGQGVKALVTLAFTLIVVWYILIPLMLKGVNPLFASVVVAALATSFTFIVISGFSKKTLAAVIGTVAGVIVAAILAYWLGERARLTGLSNEEAVMLQFIPQGNIFDPRALLYSGILLGTLGAAMDVAMSIASTIAEIHYHNPYLSRRKLMRSGMNVGRDVMGTMVNTLILAYLGTALPMVLLFVANQMPLVRVVNLDLIATEIMRSLAGSIGIVASLPLTATIAVFLYQPQKNTRASKGVSQEAQE